jgi:exodeoxyribonuclease VII small subunit
MRNPEKNQTYEQALAELDQIVRVLEDGQTGLEESLAQYERGVGLVKLCYQKLSDAERRIQALCGEDDQGKPILQPFAHTSATETANSDSPQQRKRNG